MLISVDKNRCSKCGVCIRRMEGYCIYSEDGFPMFKDKICNTCQKCVAICPSQAIMVNGKYSEKINKENKIESEKIFSLLEKRRSIKKFQNKEIPREVIEKIVSVAKFAPNQNKNISVLIIDDKTLINMIDCYAVKFIKKLYKLLFGLKIVEKVITLFYKNIQTIKEKMEYNNFRNVLYENTQAIIIVTGNKKVAVTESSAHYMLATMIMMAESLEIGSCLMDSIYLTMRTSKELRSKLQITEDILGVMILGYSNENIINIPKGYEVKTRYNV